MDREVEVTIWYKIEISRKGENDWYAYGSAQYDTLESARATVERDGPHREWEMHIVKVTQTEEVIA